MGRRRFPVRIEWHDKEPSRYSESFQQDPKYGGAFQSALRRAYVEEPRPIVRCLCPGSGEKRLAVKHHRDSNLYFLSRYPGTGEEHSVECIFYEPNRKKSGLFAYADDVISFADDGAIRVRLDKPIREAESRTLSETASSGSDKGSSRIRTLSMRGLVQLLWQEARLNVWYPSMKDKRNAARVMWWMLQVSERIRLSRSAWLSDYLCVSAMPETPLCDHNKQAVENARQHGSSLFVVALLAKYKPEKHEDLSELTHLPIYGFCGIPSIGMTPKTWGFIKKRYPGALKDWREGGRVVVAVQTAPLSGEGRWASAIDVALMRLSDNWVPVDHPFERSLVEALVEDDYSFEKVLRYESGKEGARLPSLMLQEKGKSVPVFIRAYESDGVSHADSDGLVWDAQRQSVSDFLETIEKRLR